MPGEKCLQVRCKLFLVKTFSQTSDSSGWEWSRKHPLVPCQLQRQRPPTIVEKGICLEKSSFSLHNIPVLKIPRSFSPASPNFTPDFTCSQRLADSTLAAKDYKKLAQVTVNLPEASLLLCAFVITTFIQHQEQWIVWQDLTCPNSSHLVSQLLSHQIKNYWAGRCKGHLLNLIGPAIFSSTYTIHKVTDSGIKQYNLNLTD